MASFVLTVRRRNSVGRSSKRGKTDMLVCAGGVLLSAAIFKSREDEEQGGSEFGIGWCW
jgi:hypothetical protein